MALFFPARSACVFDTNGERRFAERLDKKLGDDYLCWFNVPVGPKALQPDFMLLHPGRGLLILEVKDWHIDTIDSLELGQVKLRVNDELVVDKNPLTQARTYALEAAVLLEKDPLLQQTSGKYKGKFIMPYGWGVVLTNITRKMFDQQQLGRSIDADRVICQDEMLESTSSEMFQQRLWNMFHQTFPCQLRPEQVDHVRYHLHPEVRINAESGQFGLLSKEQAPLPSLVKVMNLQQEQLARSLGSGHRVIHGVAGSGKTMILGYRSQYLASLSNKPILVLCYNKSLASRLQQVIQQSQARNKIEVLHFHGWCGQLLKRHQLKVAEGQGQYFERQVSSTIAAVDAGDIDPHQYGAILIDEAHDFEADWFKIVVPLLDPETDSLLVLYDDAQSIYKNKKTLNFTFSSVGIQARGRTTVLHTNYRNTLEILMVAKHFAQSIFTENAEQPDDMIPTLSPDSAGRRGDVPELQRFATADDELDYIAERISQLIKLGLSPDKIAVLCRYNNKNNNQVKNAEKALAAKGVIFSSTGDDSGKLGLYGVEPSVKIVTIPSSKGLEFDTVFIPHLNEMPNKKAGLEGEARLLYVAMTRAIETLVFTYHGSSEFTEQVQQAIALTEKY